MQYVTGVTQLDGNAFGALISGPIAVPAEFVSMMAAAAGPAIERVWRDRNMRQLLEVIRMWITVLAEDDGYAESRRRT